MFCHIQSQETAQPQETAQTQSQDLGGQESLPHHHLHAPHPGLSHSASAPRLRTAPTASACPGFPPLSSPFSFPDGQRGLQYLGENCPGSGAGFGPHSPSRAWRDFIIHWMAKVTQKYEVFFKIKLENILPPPSPTPCSARTDSKPGKAENKVAQRGSLSFWLDSISSVQPVAHQSLWDHLLTGQAQRRSLGFLLIPQAPA